MEFDLNAPNPPHWKTIYKLMIGSVIPRPIAWVSTIDEAGCRNLAPFSFFTIASANPPHLALTLMTRGTDHGLKDTLHNIRTTGQFVVNIATEATADAMNLTSGEYPSDVDEFDLAGLTALPSAAVLPPRVAESPIQFECRLAHLLPLGEEGVPGAAVLVVGQVVHIHVSEDVLYDGNKIDLVKLQPIGRLAGTAYTRVTDLFDMQRPPSQILPATSDPSEPV